MNINILNPSNYDKIFINQNFEKKPESTSDVFNKSMEYTTIPFEKLYTVSFFEKVTSNIGIIIQTALYIAHLTINILEIFVVIEITIKKFSNQTKKNILETFVVIETAIKKFSNQTKKNILETFVVIETAIKKFSNQTKKMNTNFIKTNTITYNKLPVIKTEDKIKTD
jgi:hypothetical protein